MSMKCRRELADVKLLEKHQSMRPNAQELIGAKEKKLLATERNTHRLAS